MEEGSLMDKRKPKLEKVGCYVYGEDYSKGGFTFFERLQLSDGDVFVYNQGVLWKL